MTASPGEFNAQLDANELITALQLKIGKYEVDATAADLYVKKLHAHVADLESQLSRGRVPDVQNAPG